MITNPALETPNYTIRRVRDDQTLLPENAGSSYSLATPTGDLLEDAVEMTSKTTTETAAVAAVFGSFTMHGSNDIATGLDGSIRSPQYIQAVGRLISMRPLCSTS